MRDLPMIRVEIEGVRQTVTRMFNDRNNELNDMVIESLDRQLSESWVQSEIDEAVKQCAKNAIAALADDWRLQQAITKLVGESVSKLIAPMEK